MVWALQSHRATGRQVSRFSICVLLIAALHRAITLPMRAETAQGHPETKTIRCAHCRCWLLDEELEAVSSSRIVYYNLVSIAYRLRVKAWPAQEAGPCIPRLRDQIRFDSNRSVKDLAYTVSLFSYSLCLSSVSEWDICNKNAKRTRGESVR